MRVRVQLFDRLHLLSDLISSENRKTYRRQTDIQETDRLCPSLCVLCLMVNSLHLSECIIDKGTKIHRTFLVHEINRTYK